MQEPTELPRAQRKVLEAILNTAEPDKLVPTQEELARTLGLTSKANVRRVLEELETKKLIATTRTSKGRALARSFKPTQKAWEWWKSQGNDLPEFMQTVIPETSDVVANTPIAENDFAPQIKSLGEVAAGTPTLAEENTSDPVSLGSLFPGRYVFLLKVTGDSMSGDHIFKDDYVVVNSDVECKDGEMAVVVLNGEATVKRIWRDGDSFHLESSNPRYGPIVVERGDESLLQGKVIGIVRNHIKRGRRRRESH